MPPLRARLHRVQRRQGRPASGPHQDHAQRHVRPCRHERLSADEGHLGRRHRRSGHLPPVRPSDAVRQRLSAAPSWSTRRRAPAASTRKSACCHLLRKGLPVGHDDLRPSRRRRPASASSASGSPSASSTVRPPPSATCPGWTARVMNRARAFHGYLPAGKPRPVQHLPSLIRGS